MDREELVRRYRRLLVACKDIVACGTRRGDGSYTVTGNAMAMLDGIVASDLDKHQD